MGLHAIPLTVLLYRAPEPAAAGLRRWDNARQPQWRRCLWVTCTLLAAIGLFCAGYIVGLQYTANYAGVPDTAAAPTAEAPPLFLVSLDGFRADYLQRNVTPHLAQLGVPPCPPPQPLRAAPAHDRRR